MVVRLVPAGDVGTGAPPAVARVEFLDAAGCPLAAGPSIPSGDRGAYVYLAAGGRGGDEVTAATFPLPPGTATTRVGLQSWGGAGVVLEGPPQLTAFARGASVIIPAYLAGSRIGVALASLARQTASPTVFEIIVVLNGPDDDTPDIVTAFAATHPALDVRVLTSGQASAGAARNLGIAAARFDHAVFLDDDDWLSETYLAALLARADGTRIALGRLQDVRGEERPESHITAQIDAAFAKPGYTFEDVPAAFAMNACKLTPTAYLRMVRFPAELSSGEDVVFWTEVVTRFSPALEIVPESEGATYFRVVRAGSVSRQSPNFDFSVRQRLAVIAHLDCLHTQDDQKYRGYVEDKIKAQAHPIEAYLKENPDTYGALISDIGSAQRSYDLAGRFNTRLAEHLVISYCFPPAADTSAIVMAKRVAMLEEPTDVICNSMGDTRPHDPTLRELIRHRVGRVIELGAPVAFGQWSAIEQFSTMAIERIGAIEARRQPYKRLYSRALWPASHFAAALQKSRRPDIRWRAEFSDPIRKDIRGAEREGRISEAWLERHGLRAALAKEGVEAPAGASLFAWCELLPIVMADELVFTNPNQLSFMQSYQEDARVRAMMAAKATISQHPAPKPRWYGQVVPRYTVDPERISLGYFGSFYATRGLGALLDALQDLPEHQRRRIRLDIFSAQHGRLEAGDVPPGLDVRISAPLDYLAFLSLARTFSYLIVNDAETSGILPLNPYLPSKLSDYRGANVPIWAICEPGSMLSKEILPEGSLRSRTGDRADMQEALWEMLRIRP